MPAALTRKRRLDLKAAWFLAHCKSTQEFSAEEHLREQQYEVYLPKALVVKPGGEKVKPLFPNYLFIRFDPFVKSMRPISNTRGVIGLVRFADRCAVVPNEVITAVRNRENEDGLCVIDSVARFVVGDEVRILEGPFAGYVACVAERDVHVDYVVVSLDWVQRLSISRGSVERAWKA